MLDDLESKPHVGRFERYLSLRAIQRRINSDLVRRCSKATIERSARRLGLWTHGALVVDSEEDFDVLCDFCIYDCASAAKNDVSKYRAESGADPASDTAAVLEAMSRGAPFSLFLIEAIEPGIGGRLRDLLTGEAATVLDRGLGATGRPGLCIGARLLHFPRLDICMTTGAAVAVEPDWARSLAADVHAEVQADEDDPRVIVRRSTPAERSRIAVRILRPVLAVAVDEPDADLTQEVGPQVAASFTNKQGQYLAFIHAYTKLHQRPPAEIDIQAHFDVTAPTVHQMVLRLHERGLIRRRPGQPRSLEVLVDPSALPAPR